MMIDPLDIGIAMMDGAMLGAIFFGGLWWTVRKGVTARHPAPWFFGSMLLRMCIVLPAFYFIPGDSWLDMPAALLGFIAARQVVVRLTREMSQAGDMGQGVGHAP
jgi:F1F0 ATPase subunit 2